MGYVYARGRKLWIGFTDAAGKQQQKSTGYTVGQEAKAQEVLRQVESAIKARLDYQPDDGKLTLTVFSERWLKQREKTVSTWKDDKSRLAKHVLPKLGAMELYEIRPRHIRELFADLAAGDLAPRTVSNIYATMRAIFSDAVADELLPTSPVVLKRTETPSRKDADPRWRVTAVFSAWELRRVITSEHLPLDRRSLYGLMGLAGLRFGEAASVRWGDLVDAKPMPRLWVAGSYNTKTKLEKETKTENPRGVPVVPMLAELLEQWRREGWPEIFGRDPRSDDLIVPSRRLNNRSVNHGLKKFHKDLAALQLRSRRQHDLRRTFISLARAGGAREDLLKFITHGPGATVMDAYTTMPWDSLCEQLDGFNLQLTYRSSEVLEIAKETWRGGRDLNPRPPA